MGSSVMATNMKTQQDHEIEGLKAQIKNLEFLVKYNAEAAVEKGKSLTKAETRFLKLQRVTKLIATCLVISTVVLVTLNLWRIW
jgi:hypothetical protein